MKFILRMFKGPISKLLKRAVGSKRIRKWVVDKVNEKFDLPNRNEKEEEEILKSVYDILIELIDVLIDRIVRGKGKDDDDDDDFEEYCGSYCGQ